MAWTRAPWIGLVGGLSILGLALGCSGHGSSSPSGPIIDHYDAQGRYEALWAAGPNDVWAVGAGVRGHWDGSGWTSEHVAVDVGGTLVNLDQATLWGTASNDLWIAGTDIALELNHRTNAGWSFYAGDYPPYGNARPITHLWCLWGSGSSDIWAGGDFGKVYHWDGAQWSNVFFDTTDLGYMRGLWGSSASDVWMVGLRNTKLPDGSPSAGVCHWDGKAWSQWPFPASPVMEAVWGTAADDVFAVGRQGTIWHWDGKAWTSQTSGTTNDLEGVHGTSSKDVWAVGLKGTVLHWDGKAWHSITPWTSTDFLSVSATAPHEFWAATYMEGMYRYRLPGS